LSDTDSLFLELKTLIVETLALEDITASEIGTDALLFGDEIDLDSIDALEIAMAMEEQYGVVLDDDPEVNQGIFLSVRTLAEFVLASRKE